MSAYLGKKKPSLAYKLHQKQRIIKKRLKIADQWRFDDGHGIDENQYINEQNRLFKDNLNCNSKMCKYYKHVGNNKQKLSYRDLKLLDK